VRRLLTTIALSSALLAGLSACATAAEEQAGGGGPCDVKVGTDTGKKPSVTVPDGCEAPKALEQRDVIAGTGDVAKAGDAVEVQYVGVAWSTKKQFDASWDRGGKSFKVQPLGQASVIQGWNQGLIGVQKGTRRLLVIPASLGYGDRGNSGIKGGETLVFVVDVVSINGK
jgi:FKBP-type peptidyl-prolyl cis-trans isomerase